MGYGRSGSGYKNPTLYIASLRSLYNFLSSYNYVYPTYPLTSALPRDNLNPFINRPNIYGR